MSLFFSRPIIISFRKDLSYYDINYIEYMAGRKGIKSDCCCVSYDLVSKFKKKYSKNKNIRLVSLVIYVCCNTNHVKKMLGFELFKTVEYSNHLSLITFSLAFLSLAFLLSIFHRESKWPLVSFKTIDFKIITMDLNCMLLVINKKNTLKNFKEYDSLINTKFFQNLQKF